MTLENLDVSIRDSVALIRFSKPFDSTHRMGRSFLRELRDALADAGGNHLVRALVLTGQGRSFSVGADLDEINGLKKHHVPAFLRAGQSLLRQIMDLDALTIAAVNGLALGGGLELALACDIRWAHVRAVFGLPEAKLGLLPGWGGLALLGRTVPASLCVEMLACGEVISARRAFETGLVSRLFADRDFESAALAEAGMLANGPAHALTEIKALLRRLRGDVDLAAGNRPFLRLWNGHPIRPQLGDKGRRPA